MSSENVRSESVAEVMAGGNMTLEECILLRLLADDFHYSAMELSEVIGRKPSTVAKHIHRHCGHGGRFW